MRILIDGDACPGKPIIKEVAKKYGIEVHLFMDSSHFTIDNDVIMHTVSKGKDAVDMAIMNFMVKGDFVITQDYGLAAMVLPRASHVIHPIGFEYTSNNIDELLLKRHLSQKERRAGHYSGKIKKRSKENDEALRNLLIHLLKPQS